MSSSARWRCGYEYACARRVGRGELRAFKRDRRKRDVRLDDEPASSEWNFVAWW